MKREGGISTRHNPSVLIKNSTAGITLIALVITIIVLLILAGVSISLVVGDNGVLEQATTAAMKTREAKAKEEVALAWGSVYSEYTEAWTKDTSKQKGEYYTEANLNKYLVETGTVTNLVYNPNGTSTFTYTSKEDNMAYNMEIDGLGNVSIEGEESYIPVTPNPTPEPTEATVTYNANGGSLAEGTTATVTVELGSTIGTLPADPSKSGSTFAGWYTAAEGGSAVTGTTVVNGDMTVYAQWTTTTAATIANNPTTYYGKTVDYGATYTDGSTIGGTAGTGKWEIFYADNEHIYLIAQGCLASAALQTSYSGTAYGGSTDFNDATLLANYPAVSAGWLSKTYDPSLAAGSRLKYTSANNNMKATQYLLDKRVWGSYANEDADWAIGGPTLEMLVASYDAYKGTTTTIADPSGYGYAQTISSGLTKGTYLNHYTASGDVPDFYWLACPSSYSDYYVRLVYGEGEYVSNSNYYNYTTFEFRPVVCLKSSVTLVESDGDYDYTIQ